MTDRWWEPKRGFQGSATVRPLVGIYTHADNDNQDRGLPHELHYEERYNDASYVDGVITRASVSKTLTNHGSFQVDLKFPTAQDVRDFLQRVHTDDWMTIGFAISGAGRHYPIVGPIRSIVWDRHAGSGPTKTTVQLHGYGWGALFSMTEIWFDLVTETLLTAFSVKRAMQHSGAVHSGPRVTVRAQLTGLLQELMGTGRTAWSLPPLLPVSSFGRPDARVFGNTTGPALIDVLQFKDDDFMNWPFRVNAIHPKLFMPTQPNIWSQAVDWADLDYCELYTDCLPALMGPPVPSALASPSILDSSGPIDGQIEAGIPGSPLRYASGITEDATEFGLAVIFRDKPFPTGTQVRLGGEPIPLSEGAWGQLHKLVVGPEHILSAPLALSTEERRNSFIVQSEYVAGAIKFSPAFAAPIWDRQDMQIHGPRRYEAHTRYYSPNDALGGIRTLKQRSVDFHCLNHRFYSGTVDLNIGRPDVRVGTRFQVEAETPFHAYIEGYSLSWSLQNNLKTRLFLTRGYEGSDDDLYQDLEIARRRFQIVGHDTGVESANGGDFEA